MSALGWGRCPLSCGAIPGRVVPFGPGDRFPEGVAVQLSIHPSPYTSAIPCIGSRQLSPPLPLAAPAAAEGLALQREALTDGRLW